VLSYPLLPLVMFPYYLLSGSLSLLSSYPPVAYPEKLWNSMLLFWSISKKWEREWSERHNF